MAAVVAVAAVVADGERVVAHHERAITATARVTLSCSTLPPFLLMSFVSLLSSKPCHQPSSPALPQVWLPTPSLGRYGGGSASFHEIPAQRQRWRRLDLCTLRETTAATVTRTMKHKRKGQWRHVAGSSGGQLGYSCSLSKTLLNPYSTYR